MFVYGVLDSPLTTNYMVIRVPDVEYDWRYAPSIKANLGVATAFDTSAGTQHPLIVRRQGMAAGATMLRLSNTSASAGDVGANSPFTWAAGDIILASLMFKIIQS